jgi:hypothetical protein
MGLCASDSIAAHLLEVSLSLKGGNSASGRKKTPLGRWVNSFSTAHSTQNQSRSLDAIARRIRSACCARAASGHATAAPPMRQISSRRLMGFPSALRTRA